MTSPVDGEGTAGVVANPGVALALAGKDVVCVETDVRRPTLDGLLGVPLQVPGLVPVFEGTTSLDDALLDVDLVPV